MALANRERALVALLREIAAEQGIALSSFSQDWILRLEKGGEAAHVVGYNFEINSATAQMLAGDKSAISDLLAHHDIARVEHRLFLHPRLAGYVASQGNWPEMLAFAEQNGYPLICKPNQGTGGEGVSKVENAAQLEQTTLALFDKHRGICLSPFLEIEQEYRVLMLDETCELLYSKRRPHVIGDGQSSLLELIEQLLLDGTLTQEMAGQAIDLHAGNLKQVPPPGQEILIGWKHNLGEGSAPQLVPEGALYEQLVGMARAAQKAINIRFASIDIVEAGGELMVLEINSGVMMEYFVKHVEGGHAKAKGIYARAVEKMLAG
jgi:glutathione synthase/RimK-type ligase-like ATP-grasp enzyme